MTVNRICRMLFYFLLISGLFGCAHPISKEIRKKVAKDVRFSDVLQDPTAYVSEIVLWGGEIIETINQIDGTMVIVLQMPLDYQDKPKGDEASKGRFIAKTNEYLDPAVYKPERKVTVAGEIIGKETRPLGEGEYTYPVIAIKQLHLWKRELYRSEFGPYYDPWYYDYWYSPWYRPWFYPYYRPHYWRY